MNGDRLRFRLLLATVIAFALLAASAGTRAQEQLPAQDNLAFLPIITRHSLSSEYIVLGWNDLGMHCYDRDYSRLSVLPPYNNLWAQVIRRGDPPEIVTTGVTVSYNFPNNTTSAGKTNFWIYAQKLFNVTLAPNIGLAGKGLAGTMDLKSDYFVAEGVPITEYSDNSLTTPNYFQEALLTVKNTQGQVLATTTIVAPISSEMRCDVCHKQPYADFRLSILHSHDDENGTHFVAQAQAGNPVLCAGCHADPALGATGNGEVPSLSSVMHDKHQEVTSNCYACHPGPNTQCLRDVMSQKYGLTCTNCHVGGMGMLASETRTPWLDEPRCQNCHAVAYAENPGKLYRFSTGHGGLYCEACHNSTHAILPSREGADNLQAIIWQGQAGTIGNCTVCHLTPPASGGPHH